MIREEIILTYIKDKNVLDIGSVGQTDHYNLWQLIKTKGQVKSLVGIDVEPSDDEDVVQGNMETYSLNKRFDVIIAGDILEHVDNQGLFLDNIYRHLNDEGTFILTTPNAKWITVILKPNPTHTLWHDKFTLSHILNTHGFWIKHFQYYYGNKPYYNLIKKILAFRQGMLVICKKALDHQVST